jgi:hypothetical protein
MLNLIVDDTRKMVEQEPVVADLVKMANLSLDDVDCGFVRSNFIRALLAFIAINKGKNHQYGDYVRGQEDFTYPLQVAGIYFDLRRKWFRLETIMREIIEQGEVDKNALLAQLSDLGVYAAMGIDSLISEPPKLEVLSDGRK